MSSVFEGLDTKRCKSPISGDNLKNVAITGNGVIDGNGQFWRPLKREKVTANYWKEATSKGGAFIRDGFWIPTEGAKKGYLMADMNVPTGNQTDAQCEHRGQQERMAQRSDIPELTGMERASADV